MLRASLAVAALISLAATVRFVSAVEAPNHSAPLNEYAAANNAVEALINSIAPYTVSKSAFSSAASLEGSWSRVCAWHSPFISDDDNRKRQFSRTHRVVSFNGSTFVGTGGSDAGLGAGRIWRVTSTGCRDVTPWAEPADRVFSMTATSNALYAGVCRFGRKAEVWAYDGASWYRVGDELEGCVLDIAAFKGNICAGIELIEARAPVVCLQNGKWQTVWEAPARETYKIRSVNGTLYVGTAYPAQLWRTTDLKSWERVGDWSSSAVSHVESMTPFYGKLIVGFGRDPSHDLSAPTVLAFDGSRFTPVGLPPADWSFSHNFNAMIDFEGTLIVSMGSSLNRMAVWALAEDGSWSVIGGRRRGDWGGQAAAQRPFTGEWIYDLVNINGALYATFNGDPGQPALWRFDVRKAKH